VKTKAKQLNLTDEQKSQLREREATESAAAESALLKLYTEVWLPRAEEGGIGIEKVAAGGRPLQTTLNDKKQAMIHERIVELITSVQPRVFTVIPRGWRQRSSCSTMSSPPMTCTADARPALVVQLPADRARNRLQSASGQAVPAP
jgi:hypothetical protein